MQKYYEECYEKSLKTIQEKNIQNEKKYNKLVKTYLLLSARSMKFISGTNKFEEIIELSKKVN